MFKVDIQKISLLIPLWIGSTKSLVIHTLLFIFSFSLYFFNIDFNTVMLILTTAVSLEAIYLSIFILMSGNVQIAAIKDIQENVEDIQEDVKEIQEDVEDIQENVEEIQDEEEYDKILESIEKALKTLTEEVVILKNRKK
jgi:peptidoglycan hydrolase CwlO-like protein